MRLTRQVIRIVTLTVTLLTATACSSGFYVELSALNRDPSVTEPTADSFAVERQIHVSWPEDPATDTYMLYRDSIPNPASPTLLYEGESLSLIDSDIIVDQTYYYRLGKRRGQRVFEPSGPQEILAVRHKEVIGLRCFLRRICVGNQLLHPECPACNEVHRSLQPFVVSGIGAVEGKLISP